MATAVSPVIQPIVSHSSLKASWMSGSRSDRGGKISGGGAQDSTICLPYGSQPLKSASGQKLLRRGQGGVSASPPKAAAAGVDHRVRFGPQADSCTATCAYPIAAKFP